MFSRENPSTGQRHAGLIRGPPAINQREQCILGGGRNSHVKTVEVLGPILPDSLETLYRETMHSALNL